MTIVFFEISFFIFLNPFAHEGGKNPFFTPLSNNRGNPLNLYIIKNYLFGDKMKRSEN
jgi:hypothetical protein